MAFDKAKVLKAAEKFLSQGKINAAIKEYRQAIAIRPSMTRVQLNLGLLLYAQGNRAEAIEHLRIAASDSNPAVAGPASQALQRLGVR